MKINNVAKFGLLSMAIWANSATASAPGRDYYYFCYVGTNYQGVTYMSPVFTGPSGMNGQYANAFRATVDRWVRQNNTVKASGGTSCIYYDTKQQAQQQHDSSFRSDRIVDISFYGN